MRLLRCALGRGIGASRVIAPRTGTGRSLRAAVLGWIALLLLSAPPVDAQTAAEPTDAAQSAGAPPEAVWGYDLAHELMSPFCPGRTLASCPSPQAAELVQWIVLQEASGATREEVIEQLVARHGEEILGAPPAEGITLWAYVFPVLGILGGGIIAFVVLRRIVAAGGGGGDAARAGTDAPVGASPESRPDSLADAGADEELAKIVDAELASRS